VRTGEIALERTDGGLAVISISGEHDLNTAPKLRSELESLIDSGEPVLVDLSPASFVDSSILGVLVSARAQADDKGTGFAVVHSAAGGGGAVARVLDITGLRKELPVHEDRDTAAAHAGAAGNPSVG
jgi:anti-sigma B factor antagonist